MFGVDHGSQLLVLRTHSLAFAEPKEVHVGGRADSEAEPLRQILASVVGILSRTENEVLFTRDSWITPSLGSQAYPLTLEEHSAMLHRQTASGHSLYLGNEVRSGSLVSVDMSEFLSRHVAVLGSSGSGKSCFTAAIIQQLAQLGSCRIVVFDINGEFLPAVAGLKAKLKVTTVGEDYKIPYYALGRHGLTRLLMPSERTQRPALNFAIDNLIRVQWDHNARGCRIGRSEEPSSGGQPVSDVVLFDHGRPGPAQEAFDAISLLSEGKTKKATNWPHMRALGCLIAERYGIRQGRDGPERNSFDFGNVSPLVSRIINLASDSQFTKAIDVEGGKPIVDKSWRQESDELVSRIFGTLAFDWNIHIVNLRHVSHDLLPIVLGSLLELYGFILFRRGQGKTHPTLLVLEEAHHYLRQLVAQDSGEPLAYERLAKEGRKFGVSLWVSTQRPSELSPTVLAQCGTWVCFRVTNERDLATMAAASDSSMHNDIKRAAGLPRQHAVVFGSSVSLPTRILAFKAEPLPLSSDPEFGLWLNSPVESDGVETTLDPSDEMIGGNQLGPVVTEESEPRQASLPSEST